MPAHDVLIVGAGPTGLVLAIWLTRLGAKVRIVDAASVPGATSRALVVHARTLELYDTVGLADEAVGHGLKFDAANLWLNRRRLARAPFGAFGAGLSAFPYALILPQEVHEKILVRHLEGLGGRVERETTFLDLKQDTGSVIARLRKPDGSVEVVESRYLAGCDGAASTVRKSLGIGFPGGTYQQVFYVADIEGSGAMMNGELHVCLEDAGFAAIFPLQGEGHGRLVGIVPAAKDPARLAYPDLADHIDRVTRVTITRVNWLSTYHVHHRVAESFGKGRAFLLGDAAHIHSPAGGQGMNTGIGDAVNLAWKLAQVVGNSAPPELLESYESERVGFARRLVATTDRAFTLAVDSSPVPRFIRLHVVPYLVPLLVRLKLFRRFMFLTLSQIVIAYRSSAISEGKAGSVHGGDRLPWVPHAGGSNYDTLKSVSWQLHVYGEASRPLRDYCDGVGLPLHVLGWEASARHAGLARDALYLIRPDGYVALASPAQDAKQVERFRARHGLAG